MAEAEAILQGPWRLLSHRMADFDVVFQQDVALVSYVADLELEREGKGTRVADKLRVLDVYAKENGSWNQIASNVCTHPDSLEAQRQRSRTLTPAERAELLRVRESVWRAWYGNDRAALERLIPEESLAINPTGEEWPRRAEIFAGASGFAAAGGRLLRLEFPRTEIQSWGDVAVLYTTWVAEVEEGGKRRVDSGRGTEVFVRRAGAWVNPGWHLDSGGQPPR